MTATRYRRASHARESAAAIPMISLAFLTTWGQSDASGCRTINHWQLGARKPYGARLFGVFALVQIGFKFPFGERRIGEFGRKDRDAPDRRWCHMPAIHARTRLSKKFPKSRETSKPSGSRRQHRFESGRD